MYERGRPNEVAGVQMSEPLQRVALPMAGKQSKFRAFTILLRVETSCAHLVFSHDFGTVPDC